MKDAWNFARCVSVLTGEIALLKEISVAQEKARQAAINREWDGFEENTLEVNKLGGEFARLENERAALFSALTPPKSACSAAGTREGFTGAESKSGPAVSGGSPDSGETRFYAAVMNLPFEERRELSFLYRELKTETLKMRVLNETFTAYLNEARIVAAAYIEAVCPARGGKLYTRKGRRVSQDLKSIVFNNRF